MPKPCLVFEDPVETHLWFLVGLAIFGIVKASPTCRYFQPLSLYVNIYIYIYIYGHPPPWSTGLLFSLKNTVFCSTFCLFAFHNFAKQFFYLTPEKYVVFPRFSGQKRRIICVLAHFRALNRETSFFFYNTDIYGHLFWKPASHNFATQQNHPKPKNQKTKIWERIFWFRLDFCFFWFCTVFFGFWVEKPKKHMCFFGFHGVASLKNQQNACVFLVFGWKTKNC